LKPIGLDDICIHPVVVIFSFPLGDE